MKGLVIKSTGTSYGVYFPDGTTADCHVKGNFRIRGIRSTNPIAIGDYVEVTTLDDGTHWITELYDRQNYIVRRSTNLSYASHILAANVDMAALIVTLRHPETSTTFIDRFLATCEAYRVPACIIFNKVDLLSESELEELTALRALYESLGYATYAISALSLAGAADKELSSIFEGKVTLLSGNSGVGKSTLLNAILGSDIARTGAISSAHHKGMHTTTFSEMYPLPDANAWIIDTPGIKGFGLLDIQKEEVGHYFREIFEVSRACRYSNCIHMNEPGCAVNQAVIEGRIALSRYESYLSILDDTTEGKYR
jgi:ribosome biogenesis GTPase